MLDSIKVERCLELANEPFFLEEKPYSSRLPFKKRFVFFETGSVSVSSRILSNRGNGNSPLIAEEYFCENLEKYSMTSSQYAQCSYECYDFDTDIFFRHQPFEDDSELSDI